MTSRATKLPRMIDSFPSAHVPVCGDCNSILNKNFEERGKPIVRRILDKNRTTKDLLLSVEDMTDLARWMLKVALLAGHPTAEHDDTKAKKRLPQFHSSELDWLKWMVTGATIPSGFSLFISRWDPKHVDCEKTSSMIIDLPHLVIDGVKYTFMHHSMSLGDLYATIVWHPHWPIENKQVIDGKAVQLWPALKEYDLGLLPLVSPNELVFRNSEEVRGVSNDDLISLQRDPLSVARRLSVHKSIHGDSLQNG